MISGVFHMGSGLGNQLHRYVASRVCALDQGVSHGMANWQNFKGNSFMNLPMEGISQSDIPTWQEKKVVEDGIDIRSYDPEINFVPNGSIIDGEFQDERYWAHRYPEVNEWLKVEKRKMPDNLCVIGFRGGEYQTVPELFLTKDYWDTAIATMLEIDPGMTFEVHTDDPYTAREFFPNYPVYHDIGLNWRSVRYAEYLIIANSSFYIFPSLLNEDVKKVIAPRYWARRNIGVWALPQNYYEKFSYL